MSHPRKNKFYVPPCTVLEGFRHTLRSSRGNLYRAVRYHLKMGRSEFAKHIGVSYGSLRYRERTKQLYHPIEIGVLFNASGMTWDEFGQLLNDIA